MSSVSINTRLMLGMSMLKMMKNITAQSTTYARKSQVMMKKKMMKEWVLIRLSHQQFPVFLPYLMILNVTGIQVPLDASCLHNQQ